MQGAYRGEQRAQVREEWRTMMIPGFIKDEIEPWVPLLKQQSDIVSLDVGANKGWFSKALLTRLGVRHSYMIDASPENYAELANREDPLVFEPSDFDRVSAWHYAMGARKGVATLFTNDDGSPLGSLYDHKLETGQDVFGGLDRSIRVPMTTVDNFLADHADIDRINVLKIDAEGSEFAILTGAHGALANKRIDLVFFEFGMHHVEARVFFRDFYTLLEGAGFDIYRIDNHTRALEKVDGYSYRFEDFTTCYNFAAALRG